MPEASKGVRDQPQGPRDVPAYLRELRASGRSVVVTIDGRAEFTVQDSASYDDLAEIAERAARLEALRESVADMNAGIGIPAEDVLAEARQVLDRALGR